MADMNSILDSVLDYVPRSATQPKAPTNFVAQSTSRSSIVLSWSNPDQKPVEIERMGEPGTPPVTIARLPAEDTTYEDKDLPGSTTYSYRIWCFLPEEGASDKTGPVRATTIGKQQTDWFTANLTWILIGAGVLILTMFVVLARRN